MLYSNSAMVAFYLPEETAMQIAVSIPGGIPADKLHLTMAYLGKIEDISPAKVEDLKRAVSLWAKSQVPIEARINGIARFSKTTDDGTQAVVALLESKHLSSSQDSLGGYIRYEGDFSYKPSYHPFLPHITLAYILPEAMWPVQSLPELRFTLKEVVLKIGELAFGVELTGEMGDEETDETALAAIRKTREIDKAGARNSSMDLSAIQGMHDTCVGLGASCEDAEYEGPKPQEKTIQTRWTCAMPGHEHVSQAEAQDCISQASLNTPSVRAEFLQSPYSGNALKAISKSETELIVGNYMVLFGGRDLEGIASPRINLDGTKGEFFTKGTVFESDYTSTGQLLVDWEHRAQPDGVGPDAEDIFGYVDWKSAVLDDTGLFIKRVLNRRNRYVKMLESLIEAGMLGSSTEPVQKGVVKAANGKIEAWPLKRDSFSVSPMDPRMMSTNHLDVVKALRDDPDGEEIYKKVFNLETAISKARALSLVSTIGEMT